MGGAGPEVVRADVLTRRFGALVAVDGVSFVVRAGEVYGLLGPNGAGKTTVVRMLTGVLAPTAGRATVGGFDVAVQPEQVKGQIGYATQEASVYPDLTVRENLEFRAALYLRRAAVGAAVAAAIDRFDLGPFAERLAGELSGGWRQRLALGQALVHRPAVVLLDEPTAGLDPVARRAAWDLVHGEAAGGVAMVVTTHYMDEAERCQRLGLLLGGRLLAEGPPAALRRAAAERARFVVVEGRLTVDEVRGREGVVDAWVAGDGLRVVLVPGAEPAWLHACGDVARPVEPTLEDAFAVLTRDGAA